MKNNFLNNGNFIELNEIENLCKKIKVFLPNEYKEFLKEVNGGEPLHSFFELRRFDKNASNVNTYVIVDEFFRFEQLEEVWEYLKEDLSEIGLFPIAEVRGGMLFCCKQEETNYAQIFFYDNNFGVIKVSDTLSQFIENLITEDMVDYDKYDQ